MLFYLLFTTPIRGSGLTIYIFIQIREDDHIFIQIREDDHIFHTQTRGNTQNTHHHSTLSEYPLIIHPNQGYLYLIHLTQYNPPPPLTFILNVSLILHAPHTQPPDQQNDRQVDTCQTTTPPLNHLNHLNPSTHTSGTTPGRPERVLRNRTIPASQEKDEPIHTQVIPSPAYLLRTLVILITIVIEMSGM